MSVDGLTLAMHLARPSTTGPAPGLVLCHGFPLGQRGATTSGITFPTFADTIARELGWVVLTFNFRGTGTSDGDFSMAGWLADLRRAVDALDARSDVHGVWAAGTGLGGALAVCVGADDARVLGVATIAGYASLRGWARDPQRFVAHAREMGVLRTPGYPPDPARWIREIAELDPVDAARRLAPRPLLVLHGSNDDTVPLDAARTMAAAHGCADLRIVHNAGHRLRHDPRAVASFLGWLDRARG